jgi:hypothetical protein
MSEIVINDALLKHLVTTLDSIRDLLLSARKVESAPAEEKKPVEMSKPKPSIDDVRKFLSIVLTDSTVDGKAIIAEVLQSFKADKLSAIKDTDFYNVLLVAGQKYEDALGEKDPENVKAKIKPFKDYVGDDVWDSIPF